MPALTGPPVVSVFHANAKISTAKIKKYTFASERGISSYEEFQTTPAPATANTSSPSAGSTGASVDAHPAKRQRLQPQTAVPGSHMHPNAFAPRKRKRRPRHIFDLSRDIYFEDGITPAPEPDFFLSSDEESDMPPPPRAPLSLPVRQNPPPRPSTPEDLDYGAGFASYYVVEDDDEERKGAAKAPPVKAPMPNGAQSATRQPPAQSAHVYHPYPGQNHQQERPYRPRQSVGHRASDLPQFRPIPPPTINIIDNIKRNYTAEKQVTVAEMVSKLEVLSVALVNFGGVPPQSSSVANRGGAPAGDNNVRNNAANENSSKSAATDGGDESVNGLLAMFDDDEDESDDAAQSEEAEKPESPAPKGLNYVLPTTGTQDTDLCFGIEFIMNALRTWASQRINAMYTQRWQQYNDMMRQQQQHQQHQQQAKKARGRPKKDDPHQRAQAPYPPPPPSVVNEELTKTPEGEAVQAFRDVLDCGVLQVNGLLPVELTRALGTLYVQIDHLINNSARDDPPFEYMSYYAQIKAHNTMVDRWREQITKMQAELAKQQELSHQQMMTQMNVPPHLQHRGVMSQEQALKQHDMSLELRRGTQQAGQLPQLAQYLTTPMDLHNNKPTPTPKTTSNSPANAGAAPAPNALNTNSRRQSDSTAAQPSSSRIHDAMSRVTLYHDGKPANVAPEHLKALSMRSGQGMKFSFDHGEKARQLFGDQAFPAAEKASNVPRRGPMSRLMDSPSTVNGTRMQVHTPVLGSNVSPPNASRKASEPVKEQANGTAARRPSSAHSATNGTKVTPATTTNGTTKDTTTINGDRITKTSSAATNGTTPAPSPSTVMAPPSSHKRKLSDNITVNGAKSTTTSASPAPTPAPEKRQTIKLRRTSTRSTAAAAAAAEDAEE